MTYKYVRLDFLIPAECAKLTCWVHPSKKHSKVWRPLLTFHLQVLGGFRFLSPKQELQNLNHELQFFRGGSPKINHNHFDHAVDAEKFKKKQQLGIPRVLYIPGSAGFQPSTTKSPTVSRIPVSRRYCLRRPSSMSFCCFVTRIVFLAKQENETFEPRNGVKNISRRKGT